MKKINIVGTHFCHKDEPKTIYRVDRIIQDPDSPECLLLSWTKKGGGTDTTIYTTRTCQDYINDGTWIIID